MQIRAVEEYSLVDIRIYMTSILTGVTLLMFLAAEFYLSPDYRFISIAASLLAANAPTLFFAIGIRRDKGWILSILRIDNDSIVPEFKANYLTNAQTSLLGMAGMLVFVIGTAFDDMFAFHSIVLGIYFTSRMLTQAMGVYIYWIARIDKDTELKATASDNLIREQSLEAVSNNFRFAIMLSVPLFISLFAYIIAEGFFSIASDLRIRFIMYCILSASWVALCLILSQIYDKTITLLPMSSQLVFMNEQKSAMQSNLSFLKFLFALFLIAQVTIFFVLVNILS